MKPSALRGLMYAVFLFTLTVLSCGDRKGTLTITTYPVTAAVIADGDTLDETPHTITLKTGKHIISFLPYSNQYITPESLIINIESGQKMNIIGEYRNRFIPSAPPDGFTRADSIRIYGTAERKLKDGTIFDYINGGALVYLKYDLRETTHAVYHDKKGNRIIVDIFDMGTTQNAAAAFNNEEICPTGFETGGMDGSCKVYSLSPDFIINFHKSSYLVSLSLNNDYLRKILKKFAEKIKNAIPER